MFYCWVYDLHVCSREPRYWTHLKPEIAPCGPNFTLKEKFVSLSDLIETVLLFLMVIGGLFFGIFTPTEAGAAGAFGTLLIAVARRKIGFRGFIPQIAIFLPGLMR